MERVFFFSPLLYWGINASFFIFYLFPQSNLHLLHEQKKEGRREVNWNLVSKSVCRRWLDLEALGNFFFVHTPSVERLPQTVLQHRREEMEKFIKLFIKLFSQSVKVISMLEKKHKERVGTEEPRLSEQQDCSTTRAMGTALGCGCSCPQTQPWHLWC